MRDRDWFLPSLGLTAMSAAIVLLLTPAYGGLLHALEILPAWLAMTALLPLGASLVAMKRRGVADPVAAIFAQVRQNRAAIVRTGRFMTLAGINLIVFMWTKPLLNQYVPFWADPLLAELDQALFLGSDPWTLLAWLNSPLSGLIYHPLWFIGMIAALLLSAAAPPSEEKSAVLLGYFTLWSVVAPLVHIAMPAAGPIFYERMGYGARFAAIDGGQTTRMVGDYLWSLYAAGNFGAGSGISAMPSMHVTISTWTVLAFGCCAPRWRWLALTGWAVIFALSIALGWHYAADGIVGTAAALACHYGLLQLFRAKTRLAQVRSRYPVSAGPLPAE
jgi:PAP2 superfamily